MAKAKREEHFAPIPMRAIGDGNLHGLHLKVLSFIAAHDRFGANGIGCYASHKRMAQAIGCDYTRLSKTLRALGEWGYIEGRPHQFNKRLRVYSVQYTEDDVAFANSKTVGADANNDGPKVGAQGNDGSEIVGAANRQPTNPAEKSGINIFSKAEKISSEARKNIPLKVRASRRTPAGKQEGGGPSSPSHTPQTFRQPKRWDEGEQPVAERLRRLDKHLKGGDPIDLRRAYKWLEDMTVELERYGVDSEDNAFWWASRLLEEVTWRMDAEMGECTG